MCRLKKEFSELGRARSVLLFGALAVVAMGLLFMMMTCARESGWSYYRLPAVFMPRIVIIIDGVMWNFIAGGLLAALCATRICGRDAGKCILDVAIGLVFMNLWYPLMFSACAPLLALIAMVGAEMFFVFAVTGSVKANITATAVLSIVILRIVYYILATVTYIAVNFILI